MLSDVIRVLNFDGSVLKQRKLLECFKHTIVDVTSQGPSCRLWLNKQQAREIRKLIDPTARHSVTFLGSGDFHHICGFLIEQFQNPFSVIVFDHHPDWDILPPRLGCGAWVSRILEMPNVAKVILLGVSSDDISSLGGIITGNLDSLKNDRLEIYPYVHTPTRVWCRGIPENISLELRDGLLHRKIYWRELKNADLNDFFARLIKRLPTQQVYVSIDKDCLKSRYALTNWEEGCLELDVLLRSLGLLREDLDIIGLDIVGDYSPPYFRSRLKTLCAYFDRPHEYTAKGKPEGLINSINEETNKNILEALKIRKSHCLE